MSSYCTKHGYTYFGMECPNCVNDKEVQKRNAEHQHRQNIERELASIRRLLEEKK